MSRKVFLLESYKENNAGEIIDVSQNVAYGIIENGIGRFATGRDFLVKPEFGESKAFDSPPSKPISKRELKKLRIKEARKKAKRKY